ncbi:hypothetical protein R3P38DRAFT_2790801 [Favolaschia claudopus]|uniref:Uncharacterized protein n=1 Tax=Favolaschia claudopus TaxID=2862362 RepID=A0AAW0AHY0_9AGAR
MSSPMQAHFIELVQTTNQTAASPSPTYSCIRAGSVEGTHYSWIDHILGGGDVECACPYASKSALEDAAAVRAQFWEQLAFVADTADSVRTRRTGLRASTRIFEVVDTIMASEKTAARLHISDIFRQFVNVPVGKEWPPIDEVRYTNY